MAELRTSIGDIPICNDAILQDTATMQRAKLSEVEDIVHFTGAYIAGIIRRGSMEAVRIPYFGTFQPKLEKLRALKKAQANRRNGKDMVYAAAKGRQVIDRRPNKSNDETI